MKPATILKVVLYAMLLGIGFTLAVLPRRLDVFVLVLGPGPRALVLSLLMLIGALGAWVVVELLLMLGTIGKDPFVQRNARALTRIGAVGIAMSGLFLALYLADRFVFFALRVVDKALLCGGCGFVLLVLGLFALTLSRLFQQAVAFKQENDLTI